MHQQEYNSKIATQWQEEACLKGAWEEDSEEVMVVDLEEEQEQEQAWEGVWEEECLKDFPQIFRT